MKLVIVESPTKSKTIEKYLGDDFVVASSKGHITDLSLKGDKRLGIDLKTFTPIYQVLKTKEKTLKELKSQADKAEIVYLASDPDREGESIAWHLYKELSLSDEKYQRVVFNEITEKVVQEAIAHPRKIDLNLVHSQETRRMIDRIIGFELSSLLRRKIGSQSAGRVQSVALKIICDLEEEINKFVPEEHFNINCEIELNNKIEKLQAHRYKQEKLKINDISKAQELLSSLTDELICVDVKEKTNRKKAKLAFITSTLQQEANNKLFFNSKKTMKIAQELYEGIEINEVHSGLITYMRSDSYRLSPIFMQECQKYIEENYGKKYYKPYQYKSNTNSQDAHEAIRITNLKYHPETIKKYLSNDQYKLYKLIFERSVAAMMADSCDTSLTITFASNNLEFDLNFLKNIFDGYQKVYSYDSFNNQDLPNVKVGDQFKLLNPNITNHFTCPPTRYTEAKLIKYLEEKGIGRPSTYATITDTLVNRKYVEYQKSSASSKVKYLKPTTQGIITNQNLQDFFKEIINEEYTKNLEEKLDLVADGNLDYHLEMRDFYHDFNHLYQFAKDEMKKIEPVKAERSCPSCGGELVYRQSKFGEFVACNNYPKCKYNELEKEVVSTDNICPNCKSKLVMKQGKYGQFESCPNYPKCKYIKKEEVVSDELCPNCNKNLIQKKGRYGIFFSCPNYPKCKYISKKK